QSYCPITNPTCSLSRLFCPKKSKPLVEITTRSLLISIVQFANHTSLTDAISTTNLFDFTRFYHSHSHTLHISPRTAFVAFAFYVPCCIFQLSSSIDRNERTNTQ